MANDAQAAAMRAVVESYFRFVDARRPDLMNVFTDDVEVYYPKFGVARGKAAFGELGAGMASDVAGVAAFLASDAAQFVNGAEITVCGGTFA